MDSKLLVVLGGPIASGKSSAAHALAAGLETLLSDAALRVRLAGAARRLIEGNFDTHRNTQTLREIFNNAAAVGAAKEQS